MRGLRFGLGVALAVVLAAASAPDAWAGQTPSLGELALREQERRKALKVRGKVLTEQDLPGERGRGDGERIPVPSEMPVGPPAPSVSVATNEQASAPRPAEAKDEAWWRQRIMKVRDELRRNQILADALQTRINALTNDSASRDDPYQRALLADERNKAIAELERINSEVELAKKRIEAIEEEARRAGVPPGWLR